VALAAYPAIAAAETAPLDFAREYIREIITNEHTRELGEKDVNEKGANRWMASIRASTRIILELRSQISILNGLELAEPFDKLPMLIAKAYEQKTEIHEQLIATSQAFPSAEWSGPLPGVDYDALEVLNGVRGALYVVIIDWISRSGFEVSEMPGKGPGGAAKITCWWYDK